MKRNKVNVFKSQNGEVMIESAIVLVIILVLLMSLLSIAFLFYQQAMMNSVATEIAADVAKNYKFADVDMGVSTLNSTNIEQSTMFRTSFGKNKLSTIKEEKAEEYANWRVNFSTLGDDPDDLDVDCEIFSGGIGRTYVEVKVSQKTDFFLSGVLEYAGIIQDGGLFSAVAYAECNDLIGYTSMVNFVQYGSNQLSAFNSVGNLYESVKKLATTLLTD